MPDTIGSEFRVNAITTWEQSGASVAALSNGGFVVTWTDWSGTGSWTGGDTSGSAVHGQRYNASGVAIGREFLVNTITQDSQGDPSVASLSNGGFVVTWMDHSLTGDDTSYSAVRGQRYNASGVAAGREFLVNTITTGQQSEPSVAALSNGGFVVTWTDESQTGGDTSSWAVRGQRYNANGVAAGREFLVNTITTGEQWQSSVAALSNGGFVVTWTDESQTGGDTSSWAVRGQRYNASGVAVGREFLVNTTTQGGQGGPSVAALSNGGFVVTWQDNSLTGGDTSNTAVRGQRYNANGVAAGREFLVNTITTGEQMWPSVAALSNGGFVVTWTDNSQTGGDTSRGAVRGQRYNANGVAAGREFLVNTTTTGGQSGPSVAGLRNGNFITAWTHQGGTYDSATGWSEQSNVRAQIFTGTTTTRMAGALATAPLSAASTLAATSGAGGSSTASRAAPTLVATSA